MTVLEALAGATPAPAAPEQSAQLTLGVKKSISNSSVIKSSKIVVPKGAKTSIVVAKASKSICQVVGTSIRGLKKGSCQVTVTMTPKKGLKVSKTLTVKVS